MSKINSYRKNNTHGLQSEIAGLLGNSEMWLVLRLDSEGIHMHMPNEENMGLLCEFFLRSPELLEMVNEYIKESNSTK
jgi:hypothetical protein